MQMITHASQISFDDMIFAETRDEYDTCLQLIRIQGISTDYIGYFSSGETTFIYLHRDGYLADTNFTTSDDRITPASYFIEANRGLLGETKK